MDINEFGFSLNIFCYKIHNDENFPVYLKELKKIFNKTPIINKLELIKFLEKFLKGKNPKEICKEFFLFLYNFNLCKRLFEILDNENKEFLTYWDFFLK